MLSWGNVKALLIFFGPMLLPKAIALFKSIRAGPVNGRSVQNVPPYVNRALTILFAIALLSLVSTFSIFSPDNIFSLTKSRVQAPSDVLFTRLNALRPQGLTELDNALRAKLVSLESRLLYFRYGPDTIANCPFCNPEDPTSYFYFSLPAILTIHLFNLCVLGLVTSGLFVGSEGAVWRKAASIGAVTIAALDIYAVGTYKHLENAHTTRVEDIDGFFWRMRMYRGLGIAALDALVGWAMYLSSTNRAFVSPVSPAERIEGTLKQLESARSKINATGVMRNTVTRDPALRARNQNYWVNEGRLMGEFMDDKTVVEGVNNALENRINIDTISKDANLYAHNLMAAFGSVDGSS